HPVPFLTQPGAEVMRSQGPVRLVLPAEGDVDRPRARRDPSGRTASTRSGPPAPHGSRESKSEALDALDAGARDRFERLRAHRATVARSRGVPAYVVALDRSLIEMAARAPQSHAELLAVFGMGPSRVEQYGDGFLEALHAAPPR